jgi:thiol-disulfide isomerase/thioredoxin
VLPLLFLLYASLVNDVRALLARNDFASAERLARSYQTQAGPNSEFAAAISWLARGALQAGQLDQAERYAEESGNAARKLLATRNLAKDDALETALGASIEVHAQVLAARGQRSEAVTFLREQSGLYTVASLNERIHKNLNLLSLEGKPAPALHADEWIGGTKPPTLAALKGHPVLLFFWAHWCSDCKAEGPILASILRTYGPKGLVLVAPTKRYGYAAGGEDATAAVEKQYIERVRQQYYPMLSGAAVPLSAANFRQYGASSTPTVVLVDASGVVRYYHPGAVQEAELSARIHSLPGM